MIHSNSPQGQERRRHLRLDYVIPLKISSGEGDIVTETKNLSCSGAFCRMSRRLEPMTKLKIQLLLPLRKDDKVITKKISCSGVVVRAQADLTGDYFETAVFFNDITPRDSNTINEFIHSLLPEQNRGQYN